MFYLIFIAAIAVMWGSIVVLSFIPRRREHHIEEGLNEQAAFHSLPLKLKLFQNSNQ